MRDFEKISFEQFKTDITNDINLYNEYKLPQRDSDSTAGYDIYLLQDLIIKPGEIKKIPTGIKSFFQKDEVLFLIVRSSTGFKYNIRLCNQVGVIDADYYNNPDNEGEIAFLFYNMLEEDVVIKAGEKLGQGIFVKFAKVDNDITNGMRQGGFGSTGE